MSIVDQFNQEWEDHKQGHHIHQSEPETNQILDTKQTLTAMFRNFIG